MTRRPRYWTPRWSRKLLATVKRPPLSAATLGAVAMLVNTVCAAAMTGAIRYLSYDMHPFEIAFFRNFFGAVVLLPWFLRVGLAPLRTQRFSLHSARAVLSVVGMLLAFYAFSIAPLAQMTALGFMAPVCATLFAVLFLKERVGVRRLSALAASFLGAMIVIRPGFADINLGSILILGSTALWGLAMVNIKALTRTDSALTITAWAAILMALLSALPAAFVWTWPDAGTLLWLVGLGALGSFGQICLSQAFRLADATAVLPLDFAKLIWVATIAYWAYGEVPDAWTWLGGAVIFGSVIFIAYRESQLKRA